MSTQQYKTGQLKAVGDRFDAVPEIDRVVRFLKATVRQQLRRHGGVVGISGGIDSSVVLALCARAFGRDRVLGLLLPERESSPESTQLAHVLADHYGVETCTEEITPVLEGFGCYRRRDEAIHRLFPDFGPGWTAKIVLPGDLLEHNTLNVFRLVVNTPAGERLSKRLTSRAYYQIVAASNFKQRTRMSFLYYHAEVNHYAVVGTANKDEHDLGFFVKYGDGGVDVQPIAHLFKTQVYALAEALGVPEEIRQRPPTTDTYSAAGTQQEFFFRVPFQLLDTTWQDQELGVPVDETARTLHLTPEQVTRITDDIQRKQHTTAYLRTRPLRLGE